MVAGLFLGWALTPSQIARADAEPEGEPKYRSQGRPEGTVLTFYGLRQLEQDPKVSDAEKSTEWTKFIERASQQIAYAKKAAAHWKEAGRLRWVETAKLAEENKTLTIRQRIAQWKVVVDKFPDSNEAVQARKRVRYWHQEELKRLVQDAEKIETSGRPKVDRIQGWLSVVNWAPKSREGRAAHQRVDVLQNQLFVEAQSVDRIERIDLQTKLDAWRDVLRGRPTPEQQSLAKRRVAALSKR